jgi:CHAT domain-containing protein
MMLKRSLLLCVSLVPLGACSSTDVATSTGAVASNAEARQDWIAERWPELVRVEEALAASDLDGARSLLIEWAQPGVAVLCGDLDDTRRMEVVERLDALTARLSLISVRLEAHELCHEVLTRTLEVDHPRLLAAKQLLAVTRYAAGDLPGTLELEEQVHAARERLLPADHPDLLSAKQNLAVTLRALGDVQRAVALQEHVLTARERLLPADDRGVLDAKQNLAVSRWTLGDIRGANDLFEQVHAARERLLPAEHPDLLAAKNNLAATRKALGDLQGALAIEEYVLAVRERVLPADHPDLLDTQQNLAATRYRLGDLAGALALFEEVHAARERRLPEDHPQLLAAKQNLAATRKALGDVRGALVLEEYVHAAHERLLPADHPDLLSAKQNLASTYEQLGDLHAAHALEEFVHAARERLLPADHPDLLAAKQNLAGVLRGLGDLEGAHALYEHVHAARQCLLPHDHPDLLEAMQNHALTSRELGDLEGALVLEEYVHAAFERIFPVDHPQLIQAKQNLAVTRKELGDIRGALAFEEYVHAAHERLLPADHPDLLRAKLNLAATYEALGEVDRALALEEYVLEARRQLLPADHPELLAAASNLASTRRATGDLAGARLLCEHVLESWERLLPPDHPYLLGAMHDVALVRHELGDVEGALDLQEHVLAARARLLPADHPALLMAEQNVAASRRAVGDFDGLREASAGLLAKQVEAAARASTFAPRVARAGTLREFERLAWLASWSETLERESGHGLSAELFATLESLRLVSIASAATARAAATVPELDAVRVELARVRRELADASQSAPSDAQSLEVWRSELHARAEQRDALERELRRQLAELGLGNDMPTVASIAAGLEDGGAFVSFWRHDRWSEAETDRPTYVATDSLLAFVVKRDATVVRVELGPAAELEELVERWRATLGKPVERGLGAVAGDGDDELAAGRTLRGALVDPLLAALGDEAPRVLHVVPDDLVYLVPLDALPLEDGARLGETLEVRIDPSVARLIRQRRDVESKGRLVAFGGVDFGATEVPDVEHAVAVATPAALRSGANNFAELLASRLEAQFTATLYEEHVGAEPLLRIGKQASEAELVALAPQARHMHVATHGWFTPENEAVSMVDRTSVSPERDALELATERAQDTIVGFLPETLCGLALAGANHGTSGRLTAEELATLDLTNCELAVLSACETNVGIRRAGQGIQSLQTALHAAGARTAITSLWKVSDAATMRLFEIFYTKLWSENLGPADALWQAKMALRSEGHPTRDWAGWVLTGDPD